MTAGGVLSPARDGVRLAVRVTPRARRNGLGGIVIDAGGKARLKITVTAPPEDGKANAATIALLAKSWRIPKNTLSVIGGASARNKIIRIAGDAEEIMEQIREYLETISG